MKKGCKVENKGAKLLIRLENIYNIHKDNT